MIYVSLVLRNSEEEEEEEEKEEEKQEKKEVGETRGRRRMRLGIRSAEERDKSETRAVKGDSRMMEEGKRRGVGERKNVVEENPDATA
uniref:Uncharacterized protein n=1 Tax=Vespula pensylvanica TaxID=30213 RepID=A0A834PDN2_VESPE|nr:hypothetical protein H0235_000118 [Vespula pensylvanica]